jgi:hypothetical protein
VFQRLAGMGPASAIPRRIRFQEDQASGAERLLGVSLPARSAVSVGDQLPGSMDRKRFEGSISDEVGNVAHCEAYESTEPSKVWSQCATWHVHWGRFGSRVNAGSAITDSSGRCATWHAQKKSPPNGGL